MKPECYWTGHLNPSVSQFTTCYTNRNYPFSSRTFLPLLQSFEVGLSWVSQQHEISRWQADTFIKIVTFVWKYLFKKLCAWLLWKKVFPGLTFSYLLLKPPELSRKSVVPCWHYCRCSLLATAVPPGWVTMTWCAAPPHCGTTADSMHGGFVSHLLGDAGQESSLPGQTPVWLISPVFLKTSLLHTTGGTPV